MKKKTILAALIVVMCVCLLVGCSSADSGKFTYVPYIGNNSFSDDLVMPTDVPASASEPTLQLHYYRKNSADYKKWGFWIWETSGEGKVFNLNYQDDFGGIAVYPLSAFGSNAQSGGIGVIPRLQASWTKDGDADRSINFSSLTLDKNNYYHVYLLQGDINVYNTLNNELKQKISEMRYGVNAAFQSDGSIKIVAESQITAVDILCNQTAIASSKFDSASQVTYTFDDRQTASFDNEYTVRVTFGNGKVIVAPVSVQSLYGTEAFNKAFYYDGELGAIYTKNSTTFSVWSPVSTKIVLNVYEHGNGAEKPASTEMTKGENGVFQTVLNGDYAAKYYTYTVYNSSYPSGKEIVDPYAKSAGLNGVRGQIVDFAATNPEGWASVKPLTYDHKALTVWETHVADVTSSSTWNGTEANRKKFLGMAESGTTYTSGGITVKTGFDHIKELGVNAVQLVPVFDQANNEAAMTFNWGYNPLNYNVLEGGYSSDPTDGYVRIREFKQLVVAYNKAGISIIMDVVYNHVSAAAGSNFDVLMPGYYFRYNASGALSNGSGCGNETASDHAMFRKFMIDSVSFWASEYKLGGFRFDLMGLHDVDTMNALNDALKKINPHIVVYGEPWEGGNSELPASKQADQANGNRLSVGQFNDQMRDALIKGGLNDKSQLGWITDMASVDNGNVNKIVAGLKGQVDAGSVVITDPDKVVNYVTCHDNYTLYDRIVATGQLRPNSHAHIIAKMATLAESVVFTSNGTTFMLAGDEFLRTKGGDSNSYESGYKVNELDYSLKVKNYSVFQNFQKLIAFKQNTKALQLTESQIGRYSVTRLAGGAAIQITFVEGGKTYKIIHANGTISGLTADFEGYTLYLDTVGDGTLSATTAILPFQTIIAYK